ncbi:ABC transporter ATP-binding protein [Aminivibrio sp.]|uniref:ABC transporter ATP-binding protein n=1 Tax=Aminivibrio sp. TaxID=1872489 RepID=UPI001D3EB119|nr:ABC transporter ATP-binding protein [Synergistaceae bacterium]MDD4021660.1 ABC transporter ATP-binding protein [Synergistaceae bacterium]MDD4612360.1 ABC transporter ATP-binding protein [Synergistaceae bacterium]NCC58106.1 ABC transporter ATP-binding protein [Synergistales bacterium]
MAVALELKKVSKVFQKDREIVRAVDDVSMTVAPGEMVTFLGPSGCGKTTTLRMVAGFEIPSAGVISIDGRDITNVPVNRRDIGFVFQNYALFPHMSVFENVAYGLRVKGDRGEEVRRKVREGLDLVGLGKAEKRFPNQLSGGEQQRVALARVLVLQPRVLLMDEPLSNLDAKLRIHMRTEIRRIQKHLDVTCLYVTHDQGEALTMSDRIMVMHGGKVEQIGTPLEIYSDPSSLFVADFIGQANILHGDVLEVSGKTLSIALPGITAKVRAVKDASFVKGDQAAVVVRPENLLPAEGEGIAGTILTATFLGGRMEYEVALEGGQTVLSFDPFLPGKRRWTEGENLRLAFDPAVAVALPA